MTGGEFTSPKDGKYANYGSGDPFSLPNAVTRNLGSGDNDGGNGQGQEAGEAAQSA